MKKIFKILPILLAAGFGFFIAKDMTQAIIGGAIILVILQPIVTLLIKKLQK